MKRRCYTRSEDEIIRDAWPDVARATALLDRPYLGVTVRGLKLGLPRRVVQRPFTDADRHAVRDRYPSEGAIRLARDLDRSTASIVALAGRLDVVCHRRWTNQEDALLSKMRRDGHSYASIAARLDRTTTAVSTHAGFVGLALPNHDPQERRQRLVTPHSPTGGIVESRWARARMSLGEHGWPPDLNPKEIAILKSLSLRGPQCRKVLSESIGEPASRPLYKRLMTHGGRSSMSRLLVRGLVTKCYLNKGRSRVTIYALTRSAELQRGTFQSVESFNAPIAAKGRHAAPRARRAQLEKAS